MRCTLCDRCKKIVENERKIKVVTYARPLESKPGVRCPAPANDRQMNDHIWTNEEAQQPNTTVVLLIPARTDTAYFHDYIYQKENVETRFLRGRLKFGDGKNSAPFPSMVVIFR